MGFNCGIVGLPNVGKSTIFNALTRGKAQAANYPFCTIDPNVGIVPVADPRLKRINEIAPSEKILMTTVEIVDIAGLVKGAATGEGLGNQFLTHIANTDAIIMVVRVFEDKDITHVMGSVDPRRDVEIIHTELALKDLETLGKQKDKFAKAARTGDKAAVKNLETVDAAIAGLNAGKALRQIEFAEDQLEFLKTLNLITAKPILYVGNVAEHEINQPDSAALKTLKEIAAADQTSVVVISGKIEEEISQLEEADRAEFLKTLGMTETGLERLVFAGYNLLGLLTFFTAGPKEIRAWTVEKGSKAPQAAGKIHSDFERGFIRAETIAFDDFVQHGGEVGAKNAGKLRVEGKDYVVQDGDIMHFRFNV
jgi:GTP-binding protein YchF